MDIIFWSSLPNPYGFIQRYLGPYQLGYWLEQHGYNYQVIDFIINYGLGPRSSMTSDELVDMTKQFINGDFIRSVYKIDNCTSYEFSDGISDCDSDIYKVSRTTGTIYIKDDVKNSDKPTEAPSCEGFHSLQQPKAKVAEPILYSTQLAFLLPSNSLFVFKPRTPS